MKKAEAEPTFGKPSETAPRGRVWRWWLGGPLLVIGLVVAGMFGRQAWRHHQFAKERTETPPHVVADLKLKLLWIPAGTFLMGTEEPTAWVEDMKMKYNDLKPAGWSEWKVNQVNWPLFRAAGLRYRKNAGARRRKDCRPLSPGVHSGRTMAPRATAMMSRG